MRRSKNDPTCALRREGRRTAKLLKVLVIGGAVLAAACTGKGKAGAGSGTATRDGSAPERGGGVQSW
jgi:hypothetical protein